MAALPTVHRDEIDGVPVFWVESGRPTLAAMLVFRCGIADETLPTSGWTHLVEHLALHDRERGTLSVNGSTSLLRTQVQAHGPHDDVVGFLGDVTRWLAAPDLSRVAHESGVLRAEAEYRGTGDAATAMLQRFGARGAGLAGYTEPGLSRATPERLSEHIATRLTASNAALVLDGPPPPGLRLGLPPGGRLSMPTPPTSEDPRPAAYPTSGRLVLSWEVPRSYAATLLPAVLQDRLRRDLRDSGGGSYAPWATYEAVSGHHAVALAGSDVAQAVLPSIARQITATLASLESRGPREGVVSDAAAAAAQGMRDPYQAVAFAHAQATAHLEGQPVDEPDQVVDALLAVTDGDIAQLLQGLGDSLLLGVPGAARWDDHYPMLRMPERVGPVRGRRFRSREFPAVRSTLVVGDDVIGVAHGEAWHGVDVPDVQGLMVLPDGGRHVIGADGWSVTVEPTMWVRGRAAVEEVDRLVPADRHLAQTPREPDAVPRPASAPARWGRILRPYLGAIGYVLLGLVFLASIAIIHAPGLVGAVVCFVSAYRARPGYRARGS